MPEYKRKLPDWIEGFMAYNTNTEPPRSYHTWTAISCIASALQRKVKVEWGASLTFYPNFYIVLVGKSALGKGTAMRPGMKILRKVPAVRIASQATSLQALIRCLKDNNLTDFDQTTGEHSFHSSTTVFSEEFTVFLGYYNSELISALCNWYDCEDKWTYDTIARKKEEVLGVWVNLIGGTTPDLIRSSLPPDSIGGGLTSRIIFIYEDKPYQLVTLPTETAAERELFECLTMDLENISLMSGSFKWTEDFMNAWNDWRECDWANPPFTGPKLDGYCGRRKVHLMKLCMIAAVSHGRNGLVMTRDDLDTANEWLTDAEVNMALTFRGMGKSDIADLLFRAGVFIKSYPTNEIPFREFAKYFENDVDKLTMDRIVETLEMTGEIKLVKRPGMDSVIQIIK